MTGPTGATGQLASWACPAPSRCPYCDAEAGRHWSHWGSYERYAADPEDPDRRIAVARYRCRVTGRTFSLLPEGLLPYCALRTDRVLAVLAAVVVAGEPLARVARHTGVGRSLVRSIAARFLGTVERLRLAPRAGPLGAAAFLAALQPETVVVSLFRGWKEGEPKCSLVGIYAR